MPAAYDFRNPVLLPDGRINCEVQFKSGALHGAGWLTYTADANDPDPRAIGRELHALALQSQELRVYEPPVVPREVLAQEVRSQRDSLLQASDWTQLADVSAHIQDAYRGYRQALRDIPGQPDFPTHVVWPEEPLLHAG